MYGQKGAETSAKSWQVCHHVHRVYVLCRQHKALTHILYTPKEIDSFTVRKIGCVLGK